ncbi:SLC13 family permease [Sulfuricurvum sp.]|uniref:SLC13 family permease n=1 Tax=Sulfuricurvum sp. TaxID=2025608 RepID=UPI0026077C94|nr:SLC13 family permease [Sulfuricurvum sp.]MDD2781246.1 SLC13 family permease [Sulfuricurvum sp.]
MDTRKQSKKLWIALGIASSVFFLSMLLLTFTQAALIASIVLLVALWSNEALPMAVVSLLPIILFPAFGITDTKTTALNYANPIVYLFFGGFLLAIAVEKSGLHRWMAHHLLGLFPKTAKGVIFALAFTAAALSSLLSNTTTTLLLMSMGLFLSTIPAVQMRYLLAIAYGASIGGIMTPVGTAPNLILLGILGEHSLPQIPFVQWVIMVAPLALVMLAMMGWILGIGLGDEPSHASESHPPLTFAQKKVLFLLGTLMAVLLVNAPIKPYWNGLGLAEEGVMLTFGLLLFLPQFDLLDWMEDKGKIPFRIMFLFGAGFAIAKAFSDTGLADATAQSLGVLGTLAPWMILLAIATMITFTTEITSNTALISVMLPVIYAFSIQNHFDPLLFMMVATICASYAFMLPIATPPNAIVMSSGVISIGTMARYGLVLNVIGIVLIVLFAHFYWKNLL